MCAGAHSHWSHSLRTGDLYNVQYRCRRRDGMWRWMLGRALPLKDSSGKIVKWFGTCTVSLATTCFVNYVQLGEYDRMSMWVSQYFLSLLKCVLMLCLGNRRSALCISQVSSTTSIGNQLSPGNPLGCRSRRHCHCSRRAWAQAAQAYLEF